MKQELRKTGISVVGEMPWGTHFCHFYETKQDLLDTLVPYFKAGLESNEFCVWVVPDADFLSVEAAKAALAQAVPDLDRYLSAGNIEILNGLGWYLEENVFNLERVTSAWDAKLKQALAFGYDGMRVSGDTLWLAEKDWKDFCVYEKQLNDSITDRRMNVLCTYPLRKAGAAEVLDVVQVHQFAIARRQGEWEVIETPGLIQAQAEIRRLNEELEQRVIERTNELVAANEALKNEITERRRIEEELRERAADLTEAQRVAKIGNWILDLRTNKVNWSEQLYRIFGLEARDFDGRYESFVSRIHPDDRPHVLRTSAQAKIGGLPFDIEYRIIAPNDEVRIIREVGYAAQDEAGNVIRLFGTAQDITDRKLIELALDERLRFETLLTELSAAFANLPANEVDHEIDKWLQSLAEFLGVDRASFFQFGEDWTTLYRSHSYTVHGIEPLPPAPTGMKDQFPWITDQLRRGITVKWSRIPDDMPEEALKEKEYASRLGVKSGLNIPVRMGGSVICAITFTSIVNYRDWPDATVARLRLVGEIFAAAVERKRAEVVLRKSEEQFRQMAENIREVFWLTTADLSKMLYISPAYEAVWGQSRESLYREPRSFFAAIHTEDRSLVVAIIDRDREQGFEVEYRVVRPDGSIRWIRDRGFPIKDELGRFYRVAGIAEDITERRLAEEELKKEKEVLEKIFENIPVMIGFIGDDGVKLVNPEWERTMGWTLKELQEQNVDIFAEAYPDLPYRQEVLDFVAAAKGEWVDLKIRVRDGRVIDAACAVVHLSDGTRVAIAQDITERKRAEERIRATSEQLRALSAKLQSAKEEEDIRIAREIHDEMGSTLTSLRWDLERFDLVISEAEDWSQLQELRPKIAEMMRLTDITIGTMRRIASELRPSILDDLGLSEALEWQTQQFQTRTGIVCRCDCSLEGLEVDPDKSTAIFRIFQEALTNILSHAEATTVDVVARSDDGEFVLTISDNGKGITEDEKSSRLSLGILGMRERAHLIGGKLEISGTNGRGTVLTVRIPSLG